MNLTLESNLKCNIGTSQLLGDLLSVSYFLHPLTSVANFPGEIIMYSN